MLRVEKATRYKKKEKMEFSKIIYSINLILVTIVMGMSFLCVIKSGEWCISDLSPITVICTSAFADMESIGYIAIAPSLSSKPNKLCFCLLWLQGV